MHVPSEMLTGAVCPVTAAVAATGVVASAYVLAKGNFKVPSAMKFSLVSAAVFGVQMLNYPVWDGISGHLIGGVFAACALGVPAGILSMAIVLMLQTLLFADGGILMLGANILNMAIIGAGIGGLLRNLLLKKGFSDSVAIGVSAFLSVELAAVALCAELALSGKGGASLYLTLLGIHSGLAIIEGIATTVLVGLISRNLEEQSASKRSYMVLSAIILTSLAICPFASSFPDAFEWTMGSFSLLPSAPNFANAPFEDYSIAGMADVASSICAGAIGIIATFIFSYISARLLCRVEA